MKATQKINIYKLIALAIFASSPLAEAYIVAGGNGAPGANTSESTLLSEYSDFPYWENVVSIGGGTGVYLGADSSKGYILTANHLGSVTGNVNIAGSSYTLGTSSRIASTDMRLYEVLVFGDTIEVPALPIVEVMNRNPMTGETLVALGRGTRTQGTDGNPLTSDMVPDPSGYNIYNWGSPGAISWGENKVTNVPAWLGSGSTAAWTSSNGSQEVAFFTSFDDPGAGNYDSSWEAVASAGDSGGPSFIETDEGWMLAGITATVMPRNNQPGSTATWNMRTSYVNVASYSSSLPELTWVSVPEPSTALLGMLSIAAWALGLRKRI